MTNPAIADRITKEYFESITFETRHIDNVLPDTSIKLFGEVLPTPIMTAPLSHMERTREDGMAELARGAKAAGVVDWIGMGDLDTMDKVLKTGAKVIKIIKPYKDREEIRARIRFAEENGAFAVGMDIDHAFNPAGLCIRSPWRRSESWPPPPGCLLSSRVCSAPVTRKNA